MRFEGSRVKIRLFGKSAIVVILDLQVIPEEPLDISSHCTSQGKHIEDVEE